MVPINWLGIIGVFISGSTLAGGAILHVVHVRTRLFTFLRYSIVLYRICVDDCLILSTYGTVGIFIAICTDVLGFILCLCPGTENAC